MKYITNNILKVVCVLLLSAIPKPVLASGGTQIFFAQPASVHVGDTFPLDVIISSEKAINVVDGAIIYDPKILELKKVETDTSILTSWVKNPTIDNTLGELSFVGGVPNGFTGVNGEIAHLTFLAKKDGTTTVGFKDIFSVYANDGVGTQINPWLKPASIVVGMKSPSSPWNHTIYAIGIVLGIAVLLSLLRYIKKKRS